MNYNKLRRILTLPVWAGKKAIAYLLRDDFTDTVAAGAVNNTLATPTGGTRTAVDTGSKISIGSGVLSFATGETIGDRVYYTAQARAAGKVLLSTITPANNNNKVEMGWDDNTAGNGVVGINPDTTGRIFITPAFTNAAAYTAGTYQTAIVIRTTGYYCFIKGGVWTNWTLLWVIDTGTTANVYPFVGTPGTTGIFTCDTIRIPVETLMPTPIAYDTFPSNGALANTLAAGPDNQVLTPLAWSNLIGTSAVAATKITTTVLADGIAAAGVTSPTSDVWMELALTRGTGTAGILLRYVDATNYAYCIHNGTNLQLVEVINGTPNTLVNAAASYAAGRIIVVALEGTKCRAFYNAALIGTEQTLNAALTNGKVFGWYSTDTDSAGDNMLIMPRGGGAYDALSRFLA